MAITTLDGALAGAVAPRFIYKGTNLSPLAAGIPQSLWSATGIPGPGSFDTSTAYGVALSSSSSMVAGQIPHTDPGSGNSYLMKFIAQSSQAGLLLLCDRLWHCGAISSGSAISVTSTSSQTINSNTSGASNNGGSWYARDNNGSSNGDGVLLGLEVSTALGSGTPTIITTYTNSAGTGSRQAGFIVPVTASSKVGTFYPIGLQAGDTGVRSVQTIQLSATMTSGAFSLVAYRVLAQLEIDVASTANAVDLLTSGFPRIYNGTVPFLVFIPVTTTQAAICGQYSETQG